jgi:predicted patatin/cPLA2 family phospholipase
MSWLNKKQITLLLFILLLVQYSVSWRYFNKTLPKINRLVFGGGGAKGFLYSGVYQALVEAGLLEDITEVSGCSIGSVAAAFLSVGIKSDEFRHAILDINLNNIFGERVGSFFQPNSPGCFPISKTGLPFEIWVRHKLISSVRRYLNAMQPIIYSDLCALKDKLEHNQDEFTFADLGLLNKHAPHIFKKLTVVATHYPEGILAHFNAQATPHMDIAKAIRASSSLPIILIPALINDKHYMDGGLVDIIPDYFDLDKGENNLQKESTLIFTFKEVIYNKDETLFRALHGPRKDDFGLGAKPVLFKPNLFEYVKLRYLADWVLGLRTKQTLTQRIEEGYNRIRTHYPLRTISLHPGLIKSLDFIKAQKISRMMWAFGYLDTMQFLFNHDLHFRDGPVFNTILHYFSFIYSSVLTWADQPVAADELLNKVNSLLDSAGKEASSWSEPDQSQVLVQWIKERVENEPLSAASFALSRAVEYYHDHINPTQLIHEIEEAGKQLINQKQRTNRFNFFYQPSKQSKLSLDKINEAFIL